MSSPGKSTRSILIVDDSDYVRETLGVLLSEEGYGVTLAGTLGEARRVISDGFDFVLLDINLGSDHGPELIPVIREQSPKTKIVILSAESQDVPGADAIQAKGDDFMKLKSILVELAPEPESGDAMEAALADAMNRIARLEKIVADLQEQLAPSDNSNLERSLQSMIARQGKSTS